MKLDKKLLRKIIIQELTLRSRAGGPPKYSGLPNFEKHRPKLRSGIFDDETELFDDETVLLDDETDSLERSLSIPKPPKLKTISPFDDDDTLEFPKLQSISFDEDDDTMKLRTHDDDEEEDTEDTEFASYVPGVGFESHPERIQRFDRTARRLSRKDLREMIDRIINRI